MFLLLACLAPDQVPAPIFSGDTNRSDTTVDSVADSQLDSEDTSTAHTGDTDTEEPDEPEVIVIYAVRHAEKESGNDPGLTEEGQARALALAEKLADIELTAIYATEYRRTQETVKPTADAKGLEIITDIEPKVELPTYILENHVDDTLLHAGHSFTLPTFLENMGLEDPPALSGYGQLWILTVTDGVVTVEMDAFGE